MQTPNKGIVGGAHSLKMTYKVCSYLFFSLQL